MFILCIHVSDVFKSVVKSGPCWSQPAKCKGLSKFNVVHFQAFDRQAKTLAPYEYNTSSYLLLIFVSKIFCGHSSEPLSNWLFPILSFSTTYTEWSAWFWLPIPGRSEDRPGCHASTGKCQENTTTFWTRWTVWSYPFLNHQRYSTGFSSFVANSLSHRIIYNFTSSNDYEF